MTRTAPSASRHPSGLPDPVSVVGWALGAVFGAVGRIRGDKALHPRGDVVEAQLEILGGAPTGVAALDIPGEYRCLVRTSRSGGLPEGWPDVLGIAVRWFAMGADGGDADLLFATTGLGPVTRYLLVPRVHLTSGPYTTMVPLNGPQGALFLALVPLTEQDRPASGAEFELRWSGVTGGWQPLGRLRLRPGDGDHPATEPIRFDTILHPLAGLPHYDWERRLREPSYQAARGAWPGLRRRP